MEGKKNLAGALIKAQLEMGGLSKDVNNPFTKSKYASLTAVLDACKLPLLNNGIAIFQSSQVDENGYVVVSTEFYHADSGEYFARDIALRPVKDDPQGIGSAITYGRRYQLMTMAGLAPEDDDGNGASDRTTPRQQSKPVPNGKPQSKYGDTPAQPDQAEEAEELFGPDAWQMSKPQRGTLMALGMALYEKKEEWDTRRHMAVKHVTRNRTSSSNELTEAEYKKLIFNLEKKVRIKVMEMIDELYPDSDDGVIATLIEYHTGSDKSAGVREIGKASGVMLANAVKSLRAEEAKELANEVGAELSEVEGSELPDEVLYDAPEIPF